MPVRPHTPICYDITENVNGWHYDPNDGRNAHTWKSDDEASAVYITDTVGTVTIKISDERARGMGSTNVLTSIDIPDKYSSVDPQARQIVADGISRAIGWMKKNDPDSWSHSNVNDAVFDAPPGYELVTYSIGQRDTNICYQRDGTEEAGRLSSIDTPEDLTVENSPYLHIHTWNGSGDSTISIKPWQLAHDHEQREVVDTPNNCGLDVALSMARDFAAEHTDDSRDNTVGQTSVSQFSKFGEAL